MARPQRPGRILPSPDLENLLICWKPLTDEPPRHAEQRLIRRFIAHHHSLPFANLCE